MRIIEEKIDKCLTDYIKKPGKDFDTIYQLLSQNSRNKFRELLIYYDKLLDESIIEQDILRYIHIHFDGISSEAIDGILEFTILKYFHIGWVNECNMNHQTTYLGRLVDRFTNEITKPIIVRPGLGGHSYEYKKAVKSRQLKKKQLIFFSELFRINPGASFKPVTLINTLKHNLDKMITIFEEKPYAINIMEFPQKSSKVVMNSEKERDTLSRKVDQDGDQFLKYIRHVIQFDCESKNIHRGFNYHEMIEWNLAGMEFKDLVILSFNDNRTAVFPLKNTLERIHNRFFGQAQYPDYRAYVVSSHEVETLQKVPTSTSMDIKFYGGNLCSFWEDFITNIGLFEGLNELRSMKMMNIYSQIFNERMKQILISEIYDSVNSSMISKETSEALSEIPPEDKNKLKENLIFVINWINGLDERDEVKRLIKLYNKILIPENIKKHKALFEEFKNCIDSRSNKVYLTWREIISWEGLNELLIVDYRDLGPFPFYTRKSIFDMIPQDKNIHCKFLSIFFSQKYEWEKFNIEKEMKKMLSNKIRSKYFEWNEFDVPVPSVKYQYDWNEDDIYQNYTEIPSIYVVYCNDREVLYHQSDLFIYSYSPTGPYKVSRIDELLATHFNENIIYVQELKNIYQGFNIFEKIASFTNENYELDIIRNKYNLNAIQNPRELWKYLLLKKVHESGTNFVYNQLKQYLSNKNVGLVSKHTFENNWLNLESGCLIPREKKSFLRLCEYLELPTSYYRILRRIRNAEVQATRESSTQMNALLSDLINDGWFDQKKEYSSQLENTLNKYRRCHDFAEIGFREDSLFEDLTSLVNILNPFIVLIQIKGIRNA
jgi:hypothetical protein